MSFADDFWTIWSKSAEAGLFRAYCRAGGLTEAGSSALLGRGLFRIRRRRLGRRAAVVLADCIGSATVMRLISSTPHLLRSSSFVGVSSQLLTS